MWQARQAPRGPDAINSMMFRFGGGGEHAGGHNFMKYLEYPFAAHVVEIDCVLVTTFTPRNNSKGVGGVCESGDLLCGTRLFLPMSPMPSP